MQTRVPLVAVLLDAVVLEAQREDVVVDEDAELPPELPRGRGEAAEEAEEAVPVWSRRAAV